MIRAVIYKANHKISGFKISGHADFAPRGKDIVCAAVSVLGTTTANSLEDQVGKVVAEYADGGMIACYLPEDLTEEQALTAQAILRTLEIGLDGIKAEYPKHIKVSYQ